MHTIADTIAILLGPLLVTTCLAFVLYGIYLAQILYYWTTYEHDGKFIRLCVAFVSLLETCHTAFAIHVLYFYLISYYGDPLNDLDQIIWTAGLCMILEIVIVETTQSLYVYRIWHLSGNNRAVTAMMGLLLLCRMALGFYASSLMFTYHTWISLLDSRTASILLNLEWSMMVFVDLAVTLVLFYLLQGRKVAFGGTKHVILNLMQLVLGTGALTVYDRPNTSDNSQH
ncbi:hypothetical protein BDW22DRAFT_326061 [Trametopsis cervina]|nr:hypothetical protein BDW22DRAFT_326061 [Trametopsis cervina]